MTAEDFKRLRQQLGTQREIADVLGYDVASLRRFENGFTPIPKVVEIAICAHAVEPRSLEEWNRLAWVAVRRAQRRAR